MIVTIYIVILSYFVLGAIGFYFINRKKDPVTARKSYTKYATYFVIINLLFFSIVIDPVAFSYVSAVIIGVGFIEIFRLFYKSEFRTKSFYFLSVVVYLILSVGFFFFSKMDKELILYAFLILSIFDSFSQITGQLWGNKKLFPEISPNKTLGGFIGGAVIAIASAFLLRSLYPASAIKVIILSAGIVGFAMAGDLAASYYKRNFNVKDYNNLIPGHGGFLDRFDSLIAGGAWVTICINTFNF